ncbi:MAG: hypothetical protein JST50_03180 [Bacteroidetes bacterium]|jgi:hypothetical protein|nr:hypothetical protein [Bacteroidota bacterium]
MKTLRNLAVLALAIATITLNSCKKKDEKPSYSITATVDGKVTNFNTNAAAVSATVQGLSLTTITGQASDGSTISILLDATPTAGKTYISTAANQEDQAILELSTSTDDFINDDTSSNVVTVTVNSVSATAVQGTFKGGLVSTTVGNGTPATKSVTNGTFNVSYSK